VSNLPLSGLKIIDLTARLPGPYCGKILVDLGAEVIKIEDKEYKDPFLSHEFANFDSGFLTWYENLNSNKNILYFDLNLYEDQEKISSLISESDGIIMGIPSSTRKKLKLENKDLSFSRPFVVVELLSSQIEKKSMHDLNALALSGLLTLYIGEQTSKIIPPPFLPIAGITFGHKAATDFLANYIKSSKLNTAIFTQTYLDEVTNNLLGIFWHKNDRLIKRTSYLHNGHYPCYSIYQTKDFHYIALAAIEDKFWNKFCEIFKLEKSLNRFHNQDELVFNAVSDCICLYSMNEIQDLVKNEDLCLTVIL
jgi:crotonobetainyl-CoA:carnitine CoA-transferase CaiB-like acyl-CoA transferase